MLIDNLKKILEKRLSEKRYRHSISTYHKAIELAKIHNLDIQKVGVAGLLHDYAKEEKYSVIDEIMKKHFPDKNTENINIGLFHGYAGSVLVQEDLGFTDEDILNAIKYHVFGNVEMNDIAICVYVADYIEDTRPDTHNKINEIRKVALKNLKKACEMTAQATIEYNAKIGVPIYSDSIMLWEKLKNDLQSIN